MNIGTVTINSKLALAPMAGVSDQAFRIICRELGCGYTVTEEYVEYGRGVFVFVRTRMLQRSIMYVTLLRTPLSPLLGTRTLVVSSMGGSLVIPWLPRAVAESLLQEITPRRPAIRARMFRSGKEDGHDGV